MQCKKFSPSGEYFAASGTDSRLRIWDTSTFILKQEFVPAAHLSLSCTCLEWSPAEVESVSKKGKKRKRTIQGDIIVLGTGGGSLTFYDVTKSQLLANTRDAHSGKVNDLSWNASSLLLYSCSDDGYIYEWDPETMRANGWWKGSSGAMTAVEAFDDRLLCASQTITLWDLKRKTALTSFTGHAGQISQLKLVPSVDYFATMSSSDRHLRIWSLSETNSVASMTVPESPSDFHVFRSSNGSVTISIATVKGDLHIFQHKVNGPVRKPIMPSHTLKLVDTTNTHNAIPILSSFLVENDSLSVLIAYGNWIKLKLEKFEIDQLEKMNTMEREFLAVKKISKSVVSPIKRVEVPNDVKHLQPGSTVQVSNDTGKKRKKRNEEPVKDIEELPMEERFTNLTMNKSKGALSGESNFAQLLSQGLHSKNRSIIATVLSKYDPSAIENTVRSVPVQLIVPLLTEIQKMLMGKIPIHCSLLTWLKCIFNIHSAYLMSCSSRDEVLDPLLTLVKTRQSTYPKMCQLKGKLELITGNIHAKQHKADVPNEALLVYKDESSDEDADDGMIASEVEDLFESDVDLGVEEDDGMDHSGSGNDDKSESEGESNDSGSEVEGTTEESDEDDEEPGSSKKSNQKIETNHKKTQLNDSDQSMDEDD